MASARAGVILAQRLHLAVGQALRERPHHPDVVVLSRSVAKGVDLVCEVFLGLACQPGQQRAFAQAAQAMAIGAGGQGAGAVANLVQLARRFAVVFVSDIPRLDVESADQARRFTWLIDILYDHRVKLVASAAVPAEALYTEGPNAWEFPRTVSRLIEMRTRDYMALPHVTDGDAAPAS